MGLLVACDFAAPKKLRLDTAGEAQHGIANGETLSFSLVMAPDDFLRVRIDQQGADLTLTLRSPGGDRVALFDGENGTDGPEWLLASAVVDGEHHLEASAIAGEGSFEIAVETLGPPTEADCALLDALGTLQRIDVRTPQAGWVTELRSLLALDETLLPGLIRARIHAKLGRLLYDLGAPAEALGETRQALSGFERFGNSWEQAPALNLLSNIQSGLGQLNESEATLLRAVEVGARVDFPAVLAATWNNLGVLYSTRGELSAALGAHQRAEALYADIGDAATRAESLHNMGALLLLLGRVEEGRRSLQAAVERRRESRWPLGEARALAALGWAFELDAELGNGSLKEALAAYSQAAEIFEDNGAFLDLAQALERRGEVYRRLGRLEEAQGDLERALGLLGTDAGPMQEGWVRLGLGAVLSDRGLIETAHEHLQSAIRNFDVITHPAGQVAARVALASMERNAGHREQAAKTLELAIKVVEDSRQTLRAPEFRRTFLAIRQEAYLELVDLWAEASQKAVRSPGSEAQAEAREFAERAFAAAERKKARTLLDQMSLQRRDQWADTPSLIERRQVLDALEARRVMSELPSPEIRSPPQRRGQPGHESVATREALEEVRFAWERGRESPAITPDSQTEPSEISAVFAVLDPRTSLLAFSLGEERSWAFLLSRGEIQIFQLAPRRKIEAAAQRVHALIPRWGTLGFGRATEDAVQTLASLVLDPIRSAVSESRLVIVPDGALHLVPFGLLPSPGGRPLLDTHDVAHLPSASVLPNLRERSRRREPASKFLASVADPVYEPQDPRLRGAVSRGMPTQAPPGTRYLPRLRASRIEAQRIHALAREAQSSRESIIYDSFSAHRDLLLLGELSDYRFLHFATHGLVDAADPRLIGLALSNFHHDGRFRNGYLPARALYDLEVSADLVVLSACRTAIGQQIRGEGLVGLSHGFFVAGAQHLITNLWEVDDDASAELMFRFYRQLFQRDLDPAKALRLAQLEIRDETVWKNPKYWAGFIALGDWELASLPEPLPP